MEERTVQSVAIFLNHGEDIVLAIELEHLAIVTAVRTC